MLLVRLLMGAIWVLAAIAGHQMWTPSATAVPQARQGETTSISIPLVEEAAAEEARFDVYGNQIDDAVGDYRVDPLGDLYELHSPDTAILKLGPPSA